MRASVVGASTGATMGAFSGAMMGESPAGASPVDVPMSSNRAVILDGILDAVVKPIFVNLEKRMRLIVQTGGALSTAAVRSLLFLCIISWITLHVVRNFCESVQQS
jgi:hypothetical protein